LLSLVFAAISWNVIEKPAIAPGKNLSKKSLDRRGVVTMIALLCVLASCFTPRKIVQSTDNFPGQKVNADMVKLGPQSANAGGSFNIQQGGKSAFG